MFYEITVSLTRLLIHCVTYRDVGLSLWAVDSEVQWWILVEEGKEALGPEGGDEVFILEPPVEAEYSVEVQSQTAAVVHQHTQLLPLEDKHNVREITRSKLEANILHQ